VFDSPERLTVNLDAIDTDNFSIDYGNGRIIPLLKYGIDVSNPANFAYAPGKADGTALGNFGNRSLKATTENTTAEVNFAWELIPELKVKFGAQIRESDFKNRVKDIAPANKVTLALPAGTSVSSFTKTINGLDDVLMPGALKSYLGVDHEKWKKAVGYNSFTWCGIDCGVGSPEVLEKTNSAYVMGEFNFEDFAIPIRGDLGVRYVETDQHSVGFVPKKAPVGSTYSTIAERAVVDRTYDDFLPSANAVFEVTPSVFTRVSLAKVLSRPELGVLTPNATINPITRVGATGNPFLEVIKANTFDLALEWYFSEGSLVSAAYFQKDISTYIQTISDTILYSETGLPASLLEGTTAQPSDLFTISRSTNTPGGPLKGFELNLQLPLTFLPSALQDFGVLANYTRVTSDINYVLQSDKGVATLSTTTDLIGLSKETASATIYYEKDAFSFRTTGSYRAGYLRSVPSGGNDSDVLGNHSTLYVDASASYNLTENIKLILEAQNLTDEHNTLYIDSKRQDPLFDTRIGRTITVGVNAKF
jgi:TonB-dependent receptor